MLNLRQSQLDVLADDYRRSFVQRLAEHLDRFLLDLGRMRAPRRFRDDVPTLADEVDFLVARGLTTEGEVASVMELCVWREVGPHDRGLADRCLAQGLSPDEMLRCFEDALAHGPPTH